MANTTILVVEDEPAMQEVLEVRLTGWGYRVLLAGDGVEAGRLVAQDDPDLVLTDVRLPDLSGLDLLRTLKQGKADRPILVMTAFASIDSAVEAMKDGAHDFLTKPLDYDKLRATLGAVDAELGSRDQAVAHRRQLAAERGLGELVGTSKPMVKVYELIRWVAPTDASALITGESGTGKELVARTLHQLSRRASGPFVAVNCAAIPEGISESELFGHEKGAFTGAIATSPGCFERADGGTLFLDEIGEMPVNLQPKLLRVLEDGRVRRVGGKTERQVDVRVIAATHRDLGRAIENGTLRQDLYYRLDVFTIDLPPLRRRADDITLLAQFFVMQFNRKHGTSTEGFSADASERLVAYEWPGNVRELRNVVERSVIVARQGWIAGTHLPPYVRAPRADVSGRIVLPADVSLAKAEETVILETLKRTGNNKAEAARRLGLDPKTIRNKLKAYGRKLIGP